MAVGGVVLYMVGTVAIAAQLYDAGVDPLDGLGFFSVSQILLRGIAAVANPFAVALVALLVGYWLWMQSQHDDRRDLGPLDSGTRKVVLLSTPPLVGLLVGAILLVPLEGGAANLVILIPLLTLFCLAFQGKRFIPRARGLSWVFVGSFVLFVFLRAWLAPHPLPEIALELKSGAGTSRQQTIQGDFVGLDAGVWYVQRGYLTTAIPDSRVIKASIRSALR